METEIQDGGSSGTRPASVAQDSRERLLAAAVELVVEHYEAGTGMRDVYAFLTPGSVAARAGLSRGLIYHHWGNPDIDGSAAFGRFLSDVSNVIYAESAATDELLVAAESIPRNLSDVIVLLSALEMARVTGDGSAVWRAGQVLALHGVHPASFSPVMESLASVFDIIWERTGREPVPPLRSYDIAMTISHTLEGFAMQNSVAPETLEHEYDWTPEVPPELTEGGWTLLAISIEGIVLRMTRPIADE